MPLPVTTIKAGHIVLLPFPFTDLKGVKLRPALVLVVSKVDVTVAFITSNLAQRDAFDLVIEPDAQNRLHVTSVVKVKKLATIDKSLVEYKLGALPPNQMLQIAEHLHACLVNEIAEA
jgi:mRNA interferase MazF